MTRDKQWNLDSREVNMSWSAGGPKRRTKVTKQSRARDFTSGHVTLSHRPTGIEVSGIIPEGHYTRKKLRELRDQLKVKLFAELERIVARKLRIPSR